MKIAVIGAVAAGTSAAAKARRNNEDAEIVIFEMDQDISYSGCGLPYYIGKKVEDRKLLTPRDAKYFKDKYNIDIYTGHQVMNIDKEGKNLKIKEIGTGIEFFYPFDKLIIATGAKPISPNLQGINADNVFILRNVASANKIKRFIDEHKPKKAVIVGAGFIGLEMAENLADIGIEVTFVDLAAHVMPPMDSDMAKYIEQYLVKKGIKLKLGNSVVEVLDNKVKLNSGEFLDTDMVIMSIGVRPNVELAVAADIELGVTGAIKVNNKMQTNVDYIYACGDCAESYSLVTRKQVYRPLGSTANKMGRIAGDQATGGGLEFRGILGTGIFRVFEMNIAFTGLTEKEAIKEGYEVVVCHNIKPNKPEYFGGKEMVIKAVADKNSGRLLGVQIVGEEGVDKRIDVFATAITYGANVEDLFHYDLAYAPPFSTTKDPVMYTGMILDNAIHRDRKLITADELLQKLSEGEAITVIDARISKQFEEDHVEGAANIPQDALRAKTGELDKEKMVVTYCNKGVTGNAAQNILINNGFKKVYNLSGGHKNYKIQKSK